MQIYYIYSKYANKIQLIFKKILYAPVINTRTQSPTHPCANMTSRQRIRNGRRPSSSAFAARCNQGSKEERPPAFVAHLDTQAPKHQPTRTAPRPPYPHISSPTGPRADRRPRSVAADFPRERHFSRAVHRLKISELYAFCTVLT